MDLIFFKPPNSKFYCTYNASQNKLTFSALAARELNLNQSTLIKLARSADNYNPDIYLFTVNKKDDIALFLSTHQELFATSQKLISTSQIQVTRPLI